MNEDVNLVGSAFDLSGVTVVSATDAQLSAYGYNPLDDKMKVKFLNGAKDAGAKLPERNHNNDAGYDVVAINDGDVKIDDNGRFAYIEYRTGISIEPPVGHHVELFPRSSNTKKHLILGNSVGVVDEGYRGEIVFRFKIIPYDQNSAALLGSTKLAPLDRRTAMLQEAFDLYHKGDKIGQFIVRKTICPVVIEVDQLSDSERGEKGWGSSGR